MYLSQTTGAPQTSHNFNQLQASQHLFRNDDHIDLTTHFQQLQDQVKAANNNSGGGIGDIDMEDVPLMRDDIFGVTAGAQQINAYRQHR